jgi:hypothetical protein
MTMVLGQLKEKGEEGNNARLEISMETVVRETRKESIVE